MKPTKNDIRKWVNALRSGKYHQTRGNLQDEDGYCCLGVACRVFATGELKETTEGFIEGSHPWHQENVPDWLKDINNDFMHITGRLLTVFNDGSPLANAPEADGRYTFDEIADLLEAVYIHEALS